MNIEQSLAQHILTLGREDGNWHTEGVDDLEWNFEDLDFVSLDRETEDGEPLFIAKFMTVGLDWVPVSRARYNPPGKAHPAEFDYKEREIAIDVKFYPHRHDGFGETEMDIIAVS